MTDKPANHYHVPNEQFMNSQKELPLALEACLDLVRGMVDPEVYGYAINKDVRTHAFVVKTMLERLKARTESSDA
jgi:hypothetical protein